MECFCYNPILNKGVHISILQLLFSKPTSLSEKKLGDFQFRKSFHNQSPISRWAENLWFLSESSIFDSYLAIWNELKRAKQVLKGQQYKAWPWVMLLIHIFNFLSKKFHLNFFLRQNARAKSLLTLKPLHFDEKF